MAELRNNLVYVSGPISNDPWTWMLRAIEVADEITDAGGNPCVPHLTVVWHAHRPRPYEDWLRRDLSWVEVCGSLFRMEGPSPGAEREIAHAESVGNPIYWDLDQLKADLRHWRLRQEAQALQTTMTQTSDSDGHGCGDR